ncbi:MAG: hypothetical protein J6V58_01230, partial [Clostridia bacterium]|nr:hypothetical protein [Clostridia bacterium]
MNSEEYYKITEVINNILETFEIRRRGYSVYNAYTKRRSSARGDDTLLERTSESHSGRIDGVSGGTSRDKRGIIDGGSLVETNDFSTDNNGNNTTKHSRMNENNVLSAADEQKLERQENIIDSNSKVNNYLRRARTMFVNDVEELMNIPKVLKNNDLKQVFNQLWN